MLAGLDTGFFFALQSEHPDAIDVWENRPIATSVIVLYELQRKLLQKRFEGWKTVIEDIKKSVLVVPMMLSLLSLK